MATIQINVEYCEPCGFIKQFLQMSDMITNSVPSAVIKGVEGREESFEIQINEQSVYSRLQTYAFPDFEAVTDVAKDVSDGKPIRKIEKQQPIECSVQ